VTSIDRDHVGRWVEGYVRAWRTSGTTALAGLFSADVSYLASPWSEPITGVDALARFWDAERDGPDEGFTFSNEIIALDGRTAVVRVAVDYEDVRAGRWRDLWVIRFDRDGRCDAFEEWPFAPDQDDGH
jgi:hypothetical protein